ncbi:molybdopterin-dependent oxidoreductase [Paraburkholderia sp. LEh10]|uniref:molybdopterin-containing oxidoreductase family protein n=1 Tax=Paraburkholderia sp. LEh10 TaxID=2821353 RepID=UPI001AE53A00|nr:molybdopterin-dependent oxidoreductase [Paraburkholderia sp. LEh10]MBP0593263.1 molybdopterin-dependent oxidoreductase [Paraburkholderia sp. LEh10]
MAQRKSTFCRICDPHCPLLAEFDDQGKVIRLSPDFSHPSGGVACHKGLSFLDVHHDPDRLNWPQKRMNGWSETRGEFFEIDWDSAMGDIGRRLKSIRDQFGPDSVAVYLGNPWSFDSSAFVTLGRFQDAIGTRMRFSANTQDAANKFVVAGEVYGSSMSLMMPDILHTDYLLCIGSNPKVSRWVLFSTPNDSGETLKRIVQRGGKVRFVNPRKVESSTIETGPTLRIKPGTDVYFLAALLHEIVLRGGADDVLVAQYGKHVDELLRFCSLYPADRVARVIGLDASVVEDVAKEMMAAKSAAVYVATGVNQSQQGSLCYWLAEMINFITGNLGRKGGTYKPSGLLNYFPPRVPSQQFNTSMGAFRLPETMEFAAMPAALLPDFIESGDVHALLVLGGNPLISVGGGERLRKAREKLDLMVSVDIFRNATGEMADYVLPATDWLERKDINMLVSGMQSVPYVQYTDAIEPPAEGRRSGWWILARIAQATGVMSPLDDHPDASDGEHEINAVLAARALSIDILRTMPSQTATFPQEDRAVLYERCLQHEDRKIDCFPDAFVTEGLIERCHAIFAERVDEPDGTLRLISLRTPYMQNSWLVNTKRFRQGRQRTNPLNICEVDASSRGLRDGDSVRVFNQYGSIETRVLINNDLRPGSVAMTHGYGHERAYGLTVAVHRPGANCNALMPTRPDTIEPLSYMSWLSAVPVEVEKTRES